MQLHSDKHKQLFYLLYTIYILRMHVEYFLIIEAIIILYLVFICLLINFFIV